ncbi:MAG: hypothetical protein OCD01_10925 [Fibrobacterales bacterium]
MGSHFLRNLFTLLFGACFVVAIISCARGVDDISSTVGTDNVITATITGPNGDTLSGATVTLYQYDPQEAASAFAAKGSVSDLVADNWAGFGHTNKKGKVEIEVDTNEHYFMIAEWASGFDAFSIWVDSVSHKSDSDSAVSLKPAKDVVFQVTEDSTVSVAVTVAGKPVSYVRDADGSVVIPNMPEGEYDIIFTFTTIGGTGLPEEFTVEELIVDPAKEMIDTVSIKIIEAYSYGCPMGDTLKCVEFLDRARECTTTQMFDWTNNVCIARPDPVAIGLSSYDEVVLSFSSAEVVVSSSDSVVLSSVATDTVVDSLFESSSAILSSSALSSAAIDSTIVDTALDDTVISDSLLSSEIELSSSSSGPDMVVSSSQIESSSSVVESSSSVKEPSSSSVIVSSSSEPVVRNPLPSIIDTSLVVATDSMVTAKGEGTIEVTTTSIYNASYPGWLAFDRDFDMDKAWVSTNAFDTVGSTANIMYHFNESKRIKEYRIMGRNDTLRNRLPKKWILQASNDESVRVGDVLDHGSWTTLDIRDSIEVGHEWQSASNYDTIAFTIADPKDYLFYRLCVQEVNGSQVVDITEIQLMEKPVVNITDILTGPDAAVATANNVNITYPVWQLFDSAGNWTQWMSAHIFRPVTGSAHIQYVFTVPQRVLKYEFRGRYDTLKDRLPKNWELQGSNEELAVVDDLMTDVKWDVLDSQSDITIGDEWFSSDPKASAYTSFVLSQPGYYTKYRVCITAVNGSSRADLIDVNFFGRPQ